MNENNWDAESAAQEIGRLTANIEALERRDSPAYELIKLRELYDKAQRRIVELEKQLRLARLRELESPPVEPEEVYSPKTKVINE